MKTKVLSIFAIATIALISCKKTEPAVPAGPGEATIEGVLYAPLNLGNDTATTGGYELHNEFAPNGTKVTAVIDTEDLQKDPQNGYNYEKLQFTTTVSNDGVFTFSNLPAISQSAGVKLKFGDFKADQAQVDPSNNPAENKIYTLNDKTAFVYAGAKVIKEYTYIAN